MRTLLLIGIGSGDPEHLTVQAIDALNRCQVFFAFDKGAAAQELLDLRQEICRRYIADPGYRFVEVADPPRDRTADAYTAAVDDWHERRSLAYQQALLAELPDGGVGGLLVWGDPAFYDSTIRVVDRIVDRGELELEYQVMPGISSVQLLAARHRLVLNGIGEPIVITTGRLLAETLDGGARNVVVMLDGDLACSQFRGHGLHIHWGAYLGGPDEVLMSGPLDEVIDEITRIRADLKARKGWLMDTYLLRATR